MTAKSTLDDAVKKWGENMFWTLTLLPDGFKLAYDDFSHVSDLLAVAFLLLF